MPAARRVLSACLLALILLAVASPPPSAAAGGPWTVHGNVSSATANALVEALGRARRATGAAGLTFAVFGADGRGWSGAVGTDAAEQLLTLDTPLLIGSVTKTFVAAITLDLVEQGMLALDKRISTYIGGTAGRIAPNATVRQLLNHTSGAADLYGPLARRLRTDAGHPFAPREVLGAVGGPRFAPGRGWSYSNTNYYLLGLIAERVTGRPFAELVQTMVTDPLGLATTSLLTAETSGAAGVAPAWTTAFWTSGAMVSTASDLAHWARAYCTAGILDHPSRNTMLSTNSHQYGLGIQRMRLGGSVAFGHSGLLYTTTSLMLYFPDRAVSVAIIATRPSVNLDWALTKRVNGDPSLFQLAMRFATA